MMVLKGQDTDSIRNRHSRLEGRTLTSDSDKLKWVAPKRTGVRVATPAMQPWKVGPRHRNSRRLDIRRHETLGIIILQDQIRDGKRTAFVVSQKRTAMFLSASLAKACSNKALSPGEVREAVDHY